jgi:chitinase
MAYDYYGPWTKTTGHQSSLYNPDERKSTHNAVNYLESLNVPLNKIVIGVPLYGRAFCNTQGIGATFSGSTKGTWEDNVFDYKRLPLDNSQEFFDMSFGAAYCYDKDAQILVTYDNPESVEQKIKYIREREIGGIMSWSINSDHNEGHERCLTDLMYNMFDYGEMMDRSPNNLHYPFSKFANVRRLTTPEK